MTHDEPPAPTTSTGRSNRAVAVIVIVVVLLAAAAFIGYVVWSVESSTPGAAARGVAPSEASSSPRQRAAPSD